MTYWELSISSISIIIAAGVTSCNGSSPFSRALPSSSASFRRTSASVIPIDRRSVSHRRYESRNQPTCRIRAIRIRRGQGIIFPVGDLLLPRRPRLAVDTPAERGQDRVLHTAFGNSLLVLAQQQSSCGKNVNNFARNARRDLPRLVITRQLPQPR